MTSAAVVGIVVIFLYALAAPALCRALAPAVATRILVPASVFAAASGAFILAVLAFTWIGQFPLIAARGAWSPTRLRSDSPIPAGLAVVSGVLVALAAISVVWTVTRRVHALLEVYRACRDLTAVGGLIVLNDARPDAFTTPQPAGRVVVTSGLLRALGDRERRVLLAHEASHLAHRHAWWNLAADLAAALNPLLRPTARALATAAERWADEDAAQTVCDRRLVAATLVRVAQLQTRFPATARRTAITVAGPAATGGDVAVRVRALLAPPPRRRPVVVAAIVTALLIGSLPAAAVQHTGEALFEHAAQPAVSRHT
ncbi:M48 family metalloprotease [Kribbella qitaiheensis]|uniref:M48 family metalloprotease n=1 Tax=Kribbella qitaiheensis TaxID=1544730 RepID=A0A7G6X509_9ACTN|nr:M56 family metallopeptidase [Kribbella qitaiheensis]QNE21324.1 M48 family metalloprotease [Kribbella qitaiheensis]